MGIGPDEEAQGRGQQGGRGGAARGRVQEGEGLTTRGGAPKGKKRGSGGVGVTSNEVGGREEGGEGKGVESAQTRLQRAKHKAKKLSGKLSPLQTSD